MSETIETDIDAGAEAGAAPSVEERARAMGWKPASELRVQPKNGVLTAEEFLTRGETELPILRERNRMMESKLTEVTSKLDNATTMLSTMAERFRTVEQRAMDKARAELEKEREAAIASADVREVRRIESEMRDLEKTAPEPTTPRRAAEVIDPDVAAWHADGNDWFTRDRDLAQEAQALHLSFQQTHPHLTKRGNLDKVSETIRRLYPEKFENPRRTAPSAVTPSSEGGRSTRVDPRSFDALPADAKREFERYSKMLAGKGKPLTKEEWAASYHEGDA